MIYVNLGEAMVLFEVKSFAWLSALASHLQAIHIHINNSYFLSNLIITIYFVEMHTVDPLFLINEVIYNFCGMLIDFLRLHRHCNSLTCWNCGLLFLFSHTSPMASDSFLQNCL